MSLRDRPLATRRFGASIARTLGRAAASLRTHLETWPRRYVEMRTEAKR